jgi:hypothetical protein
VGGEELVGVGLLAKRLNLMELLLAQGKQIALEFGLKQWVPRKSQYNGGWVGKFLDSGGFPR